MWHELGDTVLALIASVDLGEDAGLTITALDLDIPLEVSAGLRGSELVFLASPPFTRWKSGFLPTVHMAHFSVEAVAAGEPEAASATRGRGEREVRRAGATGEREVRPHVPPMGRRGVE